MKRLNEAQWMKLYDAICSAIEPEEKNRTTREFAVIQGRLLDVIGKYTKVKKMTERELMEGRHICPICEGTGELSPEADNMLTESFNLLNELMDAVSDDFEISIPELKKIIDAYKKFASAYKKLSEAGEK